MWPINMRTAQRFASEAGRDRPTDQAASRTLRASDLLREIVAGLMASTILVAFSISYAAMIFRGEVADGMPMALWAMLVGAALSGLVLAFASSITPLAVGFDVAVAAMCVLFAERIVELTQAAGAGHAVIVTHVLLALTVLSVIIGIVFCLIALLRLARYSRLLPFSVVSGFNVATGVMLWLGGFKLATGEQMSPEQLASLGTAPQALVLALGVGFAVAVVLIRKAIKSAFVLPVAVVVACAAVLAVYHGGTLLHAPGRTWFIEGLASMQVWSPIAAVRAGGIDWMLLASLLPDMLAITLVCVAAMAMKMAGIESQRATTADLDHEYRVTGISNLVSAPLGGYSGSLLITPSRLLTEAGGVTAWSAATASVVVGLVVAMKLDIFRVTPIPVLAGLVFFLGYGLIADSVRRLAQQGRWWDLVLAVAIGIGCARYGYIPGVLAGVVAACLMFAASYARVGVVRRHLTRQSSASPVLRAAEQQRLLEEEGDAIHIYVLSGYIFFGSSDGLYERILATIDGQRPRPVRFVIIDFAGVTGMDSSAVMSLVKLRNTASRQGFTVVYTALPAEQEAMLAREKLLGPSPSSRSFATRAEALAWCEEQVLAAVPADSGSDGERADQALQAWLAREIGPAFDAAIISHYFERRQFAAGGVLYEQGDPADTIDIVALGAVDIRIQTVAGGSQTLRRMTYHTVVGEMGFFRDRVRTASVVAAGDAAVYTLRKASYQRLAVEHPEVAAQFLTFIIRMLADRLEFANKELAALG